MTIHAALPMTRLSVTGLQPVSGYKFGLRQPCLLARVEIDASWDVPGKLGQQLREQVSIALPERYRSHDLSAATTAVGSLLQAVVWLVGIMQDSVGLPVVEPGKALMLRDASPSASSASMDSYLLALPSFAPRAAEQALRELLRLANVLAEQGSNAGLADHDLRAFDMVLDEIAKLAPTGTNTHRLLRTALQRQIPMVSLPGGVWQFGWGCRSRLFKSSLSDATSAIGTGWAKDKVQTHQLLKLAGLPVPEQVVVRGLEQALKEANRIGYPVVLKPADLDQGQGVEAGLRNEGELRNAFPRVLAKGRRVILERHVDGQDVRVNVVHGKFQGAIARYPAGVTGDGQSTVLQLIDTVNRDPRRSIRRFADMRPIVLNDEARELLAGLGLTEQSVPDKGVFVQLRRAANVSSGGHTQGVREAFHPDNVQLCEQAAKLLRLDIAGIDLLIPDYTKSWKEVGGAICEINAQPQIGLTYPEIYDHLFDAFLNGQGRIPVVVLLTDGPQGDAVSDSLAALGRLAGLRIVSESGADGAPARPAELASHVRAALIDPTCTGLVIVSNGHDFLQPGLPVDRIDMLWIAGWTGDVAQLRQRISQILPHLSPGDILVDEQANAACRALTLPPAFRLNVAHRSVAMQIVMDCLTGASKRLDPC